jgi:hypothetical protein
VTLGDQYIASGMPVAGWFFEEDARTFQAVQRAQQADAIVGDVLEIGVFRGRSAVLLGYFVRPGEVLVANEFGSPGGLQVENDRWYAGLDLDAFLSNCRWYHAADPEVVQAPAGLADRSAQKSTRLPATR